MDRSFELLLRMTNKAITARDLVRFLSSHLVGDSHHVLIVITVERLMVFYFNALIALQVEIIQVIASMERWPGALLAKV